MHYLILFLFISIFIGEYSFEKIGLDFKLFAIFPELISLAIGAYALIYFGINKGIKVRWRYLFLFFAFTVHITIGILVNQVQPFAVIGGLRTYLKFLPFYLLPLVYSQTEKEIIFQLKFLLFLAVAQLPLVLYQRFFEFSGLRTGDYVAGTLTAAPITTVFLICTISVLVGFYLKKRLNGKTLTFLIIVLFVPTAINETKATFILLPFAILVPAIFHLSKEARIKILAKVMPICLLLLVGFHYAYKAFYVWGSKKDVFSFYTSGEFQEYLYKGAEADKVVGGLESEVGRIDAIVLAYKENSKDFFRLIWGAGIGNAAVSFSKKFQGKYTDEYKRLGGNLNGVSHFLWEIGFLGIAHILWFLFLIFIDALNLRNSRGIVGPVSLGWLGVTAVFMISLPYQNIITKNELIYPFIYISGLLSAWSFMKTTRTYDEDKKIFPKPTVNQVV